MSEAPPDAAPPVVVGRIASLDILRGFALLGMILAHFHKVLGPGPGMPPSGDLVGWTVVLGVAEKDRAVFALLFGAGLAIMTARMDARNQPVFSICLRRLITLYLIGFALEVFTRFSILREYAWWGIALVALRQVPTRTLLALAILSAAAPSLRDGIDDLIEISRVGKEQVVQEQLAGISAWESARAAEDAALAEASYPEALQIRFRRVTASVLSLQSFTPQEYLGLFILGLLAIRHGVFSEPERHRNLLLLAAAAGAVCWVGHWWFLPRIPEGLLTPRMDVHLQSGFGLLNEQYLAFTFAVSIVFLLARWPGMESKLSPFAWAGRLALTNYVIQAVLIDLAAAPYGFGLSLPPLTRLIGSFGMFIVLSGLSGWWLSRYNLGPIEWLWRSATHWKWQPLRISERRQRHP